MRQGNTVGVRDWGLSPVKLGVGGGNKKKKKKTLLFPAGVGRAGICTEPRSTAGGSDLPSKIQGHSACLRPKLN